MIRPVIWSKKAREDYFNILRYIAKDNPDAADRVADYLGEAASRLSSFAIGRKGRVTGTYEKVLPGLPYIFAYRVVSHPIGGEQIFILHIIHTARDWPADQWPQD